MKALVVGFSSIGNRHINNLLKIPNITVIICTKRKDVTNRKNCIVFDSLEKCISQNPDFAIVSNVTSLHAKTALKLANAGIDIFVEKPLSNSIIGIKNLIDVVRKKKLISMVGCNFRFHECIEKIKQIIDKGEVGKVISIKVESGSYLPNWHPYEDYKKSYASRNDLGGGVVLTCIHEIDYLYWFFGNVKEVVSITGKYSDLEITSEDLSSILMKFKNGVIAEIHLDYFQRPDFRSCKVIGTNGTIYWDSLKNQVRMYDVKKKKWIEKIKLKRYNHNSMYISEISHFLSCVKNKKRTINPINQGAQILDIALSIKKSSKMKKVLKV